MDERVSEMQEFMDHWLANADALEVALKDVADIPLDAYYRCMATLAIGRQRVTALRARKGENGD